MADINSSSNLILITGGCRSGKSRYALQLANQYPGEKLYLATAEIRDEEMRSRIQKHREDRGAEWITRESPFNPLEVIQQEESHFPVILLDCITLWLSNLILQGSPRNSIMGKVRNLGAAAAKSGSHILMVTNEVGLESPPSTPLGKEFQTLAGEANQVLGEFSYQVVSLVAGIPKPLDRGFLSNDFDLVTDKP